MDQTHVASILTVYDLPFGKGKKYFRGGNKAVNTLVSGWSISGTQKYASGNLFRLTSSNNSMATNLNAQATKAIATPRHGCPHRR